MHMGDERVPDIAAVESPPRRTLDYDQLSVGEEPIGGGGQGVVYRADVPGSEPPRQLAVKEPAVDSKTIDNPEIDAFFEEAGTWETVDRREREKPRWSDSEHVVGVVEIGDDLPWIAMEYMDGGGLDDRLAVNPDGLPVDEAMWIGECVCRGIEIAHNYGIGHLDLKPANVLFRETPADVWDVPKIADWGLSRVLAEQTGTVDGLSVKYAAPEQFEPEEFGDPDMLTDVYQVGALVYAMLTGQPPYTGSQASIMHDVVYGDQPDPPSSEQSVIAAEIDDAVLTALATEKSDRYRSIAALEQALRAIRTEDSDADRATDPDQTESTDTWPMFGGGPARTGHRSTVGPVDSVTVQWSFQTGDRVESSPAVVDGTVYAGSHDHNVYALSAEDGSEQWAFETESFVDWSPVVVDGTVYVASFDNTVYALSAADGSKQWSFETGGRVKSSLAVVDDTVYIGSKDHNVYALSAEDGSERWSFETGDWVLSSPAVVDDTVYVGSDDFRVYALSAADGTEQWAFETWTNSAPAVVDGTVYVGAREGPVSALSAADGTEQWAFETGDGVVKSSPAVVDDTVYVGSWDENVYALSAEDGSKRWAFETGDWVESSPAVVDGTVYVGSNDNNVYALSAEDGTKQWSFETGDKVESSPAVVDGTVYVGGNDGYVYALSEDDC